MRNVPCPSPASAARSWPRSATAPPGTVLTDELAAAPYEALSPAERDELVAELDPVTAKLVAAGSR
ncbi:hypothetical protein ACSHWB_41290 [Lentzea sp. HUAS TT2]|uniref:hypothetical protein n=1 Tax=Lentzea sp. HUAS TT2 TaxID=3447454 RepID=UPI003F6F9328